MVLVWLLWVAAFRCCAQLIFSAAGANKLSAAEGSSHKDLTTAQTAVFTWQTVHSRFFPHSLWFFD